ncbi:transposase [Solibacillus sp. CAU 1738]|uniref:transposase n=1 Tax=Solibacillus sp. CAU 1738 TaxID=3140363 RepID=UPI003261012D
MKLILVVMSIFLPIAMFVMQRFFGKTRILFNALAILSALIFGNIASLAIYEILKDRTVFMTNIHAIFLNPYFLITGSYLGIYIIYRLLVIIKAES